MELARGGALDRGRPDFNLLPFGPAFVPSSGRGELTAEGRNRSRHFPKSADAHP